jgi:hypothetical protein
LIDATISSALAPGPKTAAMPAARMSSRSLFGHDAADDHRDVRSLGPQRFDDQRGQGQVRSRQHREADDVDVFLDGRDRHGLGRLEESGVDDLHAGVAQEARHDLDAAVVPVEADLGDEHPNGHSVGTSTWRPKTFSIAPIISPTVTSARRR